MQKSSSASAPIHLGGDFFPTKRESDGSRVQQHSLDLESLVESPIEWSVAVLVVVDDRISPAPCVAPNLMVNTSLGENA